MTPKRIATANTLISSSARGLKILAGLRHPNLARVFDFGRLDDGRVFYTSDLAHGEPLSRLAGRVSVADVCGILAALCRVLDFLGARGLVDNDVKVHLDPPGHEVVAATVVAAIESAGR